MNETTFVILKRIFLILVGLFLFPIGLIEIGWYAHKFYTLRRSEVQYHTEIENIAEEVEI